MPRSPLARRLAPVFAALVLLLPLPGLALNMDPTETYIEEEILVAFRPDVPSLLRLDAVEDLEATVVRTAPRLGYDRIAVPAGSDVHAAIRTLERNPDVLWAEPNYLRGISSPQCPQDPYLKDLPATENQWGIFKTRAQTLWRRGGGGDSALVIAIIDTGINSFSTPHPDLAPNFISGGWDFVGNDAVPQDAGAFAGHGTNVGGVAAAAENAIGIAGVAYCSKLLYFRTMDCTINSTCPGTVDDIAAAIVAAADSGAAVINLSLGAPTYSQAERNAVLYAIDSGSMVVAASGNDTAAAVSFPAGYPEVIAVGATDSADGVASFSNYGPQLDLCAPGVGIWTTDGASGYKAVDGTSFASPFIAGVMALLLSRNPDMTLLEMESWLTTHTVPTSDPAKDGAGRIEFDGTEDWSDLPGYTPTRHENYFWEWLGADASNEKGTTDPLDQDGLPNTPDAILDADMYDDGVFPSSFAYLPFLPKHLVDIGVGGPHRFDVDLSVCDATGPRYTGADSTSLHVDVFVDWDDDKSFFGTPDPEHAINDAVEDPTTWTGNSLSATYAVGGGGEPVWDEHIPGNPLAVRTRLSYGSSPGNADMDVPFGEVEDVRFINYVEDFDVSLYAANMAPLMIMGSWGFSPDPTPFWSHHGTWEYASAPHPPAGEECNGVIEGADVMKSFVMNWTEWTKGFIQFSYQHGHAGCPGPDAGDFCRAELHVDGMVVDTIPLPPFSGGTILKDYSAFCGAASVEMHFISETDVSGWLFVDDFFAWAYDDEKPVPVSDLTVARAAGSSQLDLDWTDTAENDMTPSPPTEPSALTQQFRYSKDPITTDTDWFNATPFSYADLVGAPSIPGPAGAANSVSFRVPSAWQAYHVAMKTGDQLTNISPLSNVPTIANVPLPGVTTSNGPVDSVAAGTTLCYNVTVTNTGNIDDLYEIEVVSDNGWTAYVNDPLFPAEQPDKISQQIAAGGSAVLEIKLEVAAAAVAGTVDTVTVTSTSTSGLAFGKGFKATVVTPGAVDSPVLAGLPGVADVDFAGPNPSRLETELQLALPARERASLQVFDVTGRRVATLVDGPLDAGYHRIRWDGTDSGGARTPSGVYFLKARTESLDRVLRIVRLQ